jgi:subtilisin family serine protease
MKRLFLFYASIIVALFTVLSCSKTDQPITLYNNTPITLQANIDTIVNDRYIVVYSSSVSDPEIETEVLKNKHNFNYGHIFKKAIHGFSAKLTKDNLENLRREKDVLYIEPDVIQHADVQIVPSGISRIAANFNKTFLSLSDIGVAVIDSGVDIKHPDLNIAGGIRFYSEDKKSGFKSYSDSKYDDDLGHGTHVAGIIGALDDDNGVVGVAPGCKIWAVKVLDKKGDGYTSDMIRALEWVAERSSDIQIINLSVTGTGYSEAYREAIKYCVSKGIIIFAAAGNSGRDVYGYDNIFGDLDDEMPSSFPEVATVSALADSDGIPGGFGEITPWGPDDSFAVFSNFSSSVVNNNPVKSPGKAIDLIMPGVNIYSTYLNKKYEVMSGTSMACPHAAGLAALYIAKYGRAHDSLGVYAIRQALIDNGQYQTGEIGLSILNDPDGNYEKLGCAEQFKY